MHAPCLVALQGAASYIFSLVWVVVVDFLPLSWPLSLSLLALASLGFVAFGAGHGKCCRPVQLGMPHAQQSKSESVIQLTVVPELGAVLSVGWFGELLHPCYC